MLAIFRNPRTGLYSSAEFKIPLTDSESTVSLDLKYCLKSIALQFISANGALGVNDAAEFRHFRYLLAVAEHKGFRAAAERLNLTQPSLSKQAQEFQEAFKLRLFQRTRSGRTRLTPTGTAFIPIARDLLDARDDAIAALLYIQKGATPVLRLGCSSFVDGDLCQSAYELHKQLMPSCAIYPTHGDTSQLLQELSNDRIDAAIVTLPVSDPRFRVENIKKDRLVVCLPADDPLASKAALLPIDIENKLTIFRHPAQHPMAHARLLELLSEIGVESDQQSHSSHPHDTQMLVKQGFGFALMREGTTLESGLTTRPIIGVDWTVDTVLVFKANTSLKTLPIVVRNLRRKYMPLEQNRIPKKPSLKVATKESATQDSLFG